MKRWNLLPRLLFVLITLSPLSSFSQSDLSDLIDEREKLYDSYDYLKDQKNSFFGTQSKKDLKKIIGNLKGIILMDSEIISAIKKQESMQKIDLRLDQKNSTTDNYELQNELVKYKRLHGKNLEEIKKLQAELGTEGGGKFNAQLTILIMGIIIILLMLYVYNLKKNSPKRRVRK